MNKDVILVSQHPVTSEYGRGELQIQNTLEAIYELNTSDYIMAQCRCRFRSNIKRN